MKLCGVGLCLFFSVLAADAQGVHSYALLGGGRNDIKYLDIGTRQETVSGDKVAWLLIVNGKSVASKVSHNLIQMQVKCSTWESVIRYAISYGWNGETLDSGTGDGSVQPIIPGSLGEAAANYMCKGIDPFPDTKALPDLDSAVATARLVLGADDRKKSSELPSRSPTKSKSTKLPSGRI